MTPHEPSPQALELAASLRGLGRSLQRRRRVVLVTSLAVFGLVQVVGFLWPPTYAARAAVLIQSPRLSSQLPVGRESPTVVSAGVTEEEVNSEIALLTSREVLEGAMLDTRLDELPQPWYLRVLYSPLRLYEGAHAWYHERPRPDARSRALEGLGRSVAAERLKESNVFVVTYRSGDPRLAETVLDRLLARYVDRHLEVHAPPQVAPLFAEEVSSAEQQIAREEAEIQGLKGQADAVDLVGEREVQLQLDATLREEASSLGRRLAELSGMIAKYDQTLSGDAAGSPVRDDSLAALRDELFKLELEQVRLEGVYKDDFPLVLENRRKVEEGKKAVERQRARALENSPTLAVAHQERSRLAAERDGVEQRLAVVRQQLQESRTRLRALDRLVVASRRAERRIKADEDRYLLYRAQGERARVSVALEKARVTNVSVAQRATASSKPVQPKRLVVLVVSVVGGLLAGLLAALGLELRDAGLAQVLAAVAPPEASA